MNATRIVGIVMIVLGAVALAVGSFSYTKSTHEANLGPISLSVDEKENVFIPPWASVVFIVVGGALVAVGGNKRG